MNQDHTKIDRMHTGKGFIAALDQSGGSTPKALKAYGVDESAYTNEEEMFDEIHKMRSRIMTAPAFTSEKIIASILFEMTLDKQVEGVPTATYLNNKGILPILKVDSGLAAIEDQVQLMKPIVDLDIKLEKAVKAGVFGTKMRSFIQGANEAGIKAVVEQQFEVAKQIISYGLVPIIEPEVSIVISDRAQADEILLRELQKGLDALPADQKVMLKLSLPAKDGYYDEIQKDPHVVRVVALSGGYPQAEADAILARNKGIIASFSRALTEGLFAQQSDAEFHEKIGAAIDAIYQASIT